MSTRFKTQKTILILDEDQAIIQVMSRILRERGFRAWGARTCTDATQLLEKQPVDLLLLSSQIPDQDALVFLSHSRQRRPSVPVVMLTGPGCKATRIQAALECGAAGCVSKDMNAHEIMTEVRRTLSNQVTALAKMPPWLNSLLNTWKRLADQFDQPAGKRRARHKKKVLY